MIAIVFGGYLDKHCENMTSYSINALCKIFDDNVIIIDFFKSNKLQKICGEHKYIKVNFDDCKDYYDVYKKSKYVIEKNKIEKVIWYRNLMNIDYRSERYYSINSLEKKMKNKQYDFVNYKSTRTIHERYLFMKALSKKCGIIIQFVQDINEFTFDKTINFKNKFYKTYLAQVNGFIFMPTFELGLSLFNNRSNKKEQDFVFYCTAKTEDRQYISDRKCELENMCYDIKIVCIGDKHGCIKEDEYDDKLAKSYFTLCIPAYNDKHFSIWRIIEALNNNCVCLVLSNNDMNDLLKTFPDIYEVIKKYNLIINDFNELQKKIVELKPKHKNIIEEMKQTKSIRKVSDINWCKKRWKKMLKEE